MSTEHTKSIATRLADELFNKGNLGIVDELIASDAIDHNEPLGTNCRQHFKQVATLLRSAFPDLHFAFGDAVAEGDKVSARLTLHLSRNVDSQVERVERAPAAHAGLTLALTELAKAAQPSR